MLLILSVLSLLIALSDGQTCPPADSIAPCMCDTWPELTLSCYDVATEDDLRNAFNNPNNPVTYFSEITITFGGFGSLGADLFGPLTARSVSIKNNPNLISLDVNLLRGPMSETVAYIDISSNSLLQDIDLRIADVLTYSSVTINAHTNGAINVIAPTVPTTIYYLSIGRNNFGEIRKDMLANMPNLQYLYMHESNIMTIEPGLFASFPMLNELQIHMNSLGPRIEEGVLELPSTLTTLVLDNNNIQELMPGALAGFSQFAYISLWSNELNAFPEATYRPILEKLVYGGGTLSLAYNYNLPCDCSIVWLFLSPELLDAVDQYYCGDPFTPITDIDSGALIAECTP